MCTHQVLIITGIIGFLSSCHHYYLQCHHLRCNVISMIMTKRMPAEQEPSLLIYSWIVGGAWSRRGSPRKPPLQGSSMYLFIKVGVIWEVEGEGGSSDSRDKFGSELLWDWGSLLSAPQFGLPEHDLNIAWTLSEHYLKISWTLPEVEHYTYRDEVLDHWRLWTKSFDAIILEITNFDMICIQHMEDNY